MLAPYAWCIMFIAQGSGEKESAVIAWASSVAASNLKVMVASLGNSKRISPEMIGCFGGHGTHPHIWLRHP